MATLEELTQAALQAFAASGFPYALAGGLAANAWVPASSVFATFDVDVAVAVGEREAEALLAHVERELGRDVAGFRGETLELPKARIDRFIAPPDVVLDVVRARSLRFAKEATRRAREIELRERRFKVLSPEDVVLYKSLAARPKDVAPIAAIAAAQPLDWAYLEAWARRLGRWSFLSKAAR